MSERRVKTAKSLLERLSVDSDGPSGLSTSPLGTLTDLVKKNAASVMEPAECDELVSKLLSEDKATIPQEEAIKLLSVVDVAGLLVHPYFIRASARRGVSFYVASDGSVNRQKFTGAAVATPLIDGKIEADFFVEPEWFPYMAQFVESGMPVLLIGPSGSGKTASVERLFEQREQTLQIVSCTPSMLADDFEGKIDLKGGQTVFTPSACAIAVSSGHGLLLDEVDAAPAEACYSLYRALAGKDMRIARLGHEGTISPDPNFRAVGTQNTEGRGDDRGIHHGRAYQDEAFLDRWHNYIRVDYPPFDTEVLVLCKKTGIPKANAQQVVRVATELRRAFASDQIMLCMTMRRSLSVAANIAAGLSPETAWRFAVWNRATTEDQRTIEEFVNRVYGSTAKKG
jgi:MoxR-like ATPase